VLGERVFYRKWKRRWSPFDVMMMALWLREQRQEERPQVEGGMSWGDVKTTKPK
jgi:hypothetical protein